MMGWKAATVVAVFLGCISVFTESLQQAKPFSSIKQLPGGHGPMPAKIGMRDSHRPCSIDLKCWSVFLYNSNPMGW